MMIRMKNSNCLDYALFFLTRMSKLNRSLLRETLSFLDLIDRQARPLANVSVLTQGEAAELDDNTLPTVFPRNLKDG